MKYKTNSDGDVDKKQIAKDVVELKKSNPQLDIEVEIDFTAYVRKLINKSRTL